MTHTKLLYENHIQRITERISPLLNNEEKLNEFITYYRKVYDKFGCVHLDYHLAFLLYDDMKGVMSNNVAWYIICGAGGTGKTTLAKNIAYFLDQTLDRNRIVTDLVSGIKLMSSWPTSGSFKSIIYDEPDMEIHGNSKIGRSIRSAYGKSRQQQIYNIFCATDLRDIPPWIMGKATCIIFCSKKEDHNYGEAIVIKDDPKRYSYPLSDVRKEYFDKNWYVFFDKLKQGQALRIHTYNKSPLSSEEERIYKEEKAKDFSETLKRVFAVDRKDPNADKKNLERFKQMKELYEQGLSKSEIARKMNLTTVRVNQIFREFSSENIKKT